MLKFSRAVLACLSLCLGAPSQAGADAPQLAQGRRIYEDGVLGSGAPLQGRRADGTQVSGATAACSSCHRPSGMGNVEGDIQVAPITGRFLFPEDGDRPMATMNPRTGKRMSLRRQPHTDASLAQAIRAGQGSSGQALSPLMPRYANLGEADMAALGAYLRQLSVDPSPGVEDRTLRFATVITPGVEAGRKKIMLDMLRTMLMQKNGSTVTSNHSRRHMVTAAELVLGTENRWALDVWELTGEPATWGEQLRGYYKLAPAFALVSGLGNGTWAPVEEFCESEHIPCWFPSVPAPPERDKAPRYAFYFSRGVGLEAEVLNRHWSQSKMPRKVLQLVRGSDASATAAARLERLLAALPAKQRPSVQTLDVSRLDQPEALAKALRGLEAQDALMLWLRPADLRAHAAVLAQSAATPYASGELLSGSPAFMPDELRPRVRLVFPFELPQAREANIAYMHIWLKLRRLPVVDEALQSQVYFAMNLLTDTLTDMLDNLYRDYLVERTESMITQRETRKAEDEVREQALVRPRTRRTPMDASIPQPAFGPGYAEHTYGLREGTTVYPRLSLGPGQRYASKGAYIAHFEANDLQSARLVADSDWIVP